MRPSFLLLALPLATFAAPLSAQDIVYAPGTGDARYSNADAAEYDNPDAGDYHDAGISPVAGRLSDPIVQDRVALMVENMAGAIMNMPIDGITQAIETARPGTVRPTLRRGATVADVAGRDARYLPRELGDESRAAVGMMGGVARAVASMTPAIETMARDMQDQIEVAKEEARRPRNR